MRIVRKASMLFALTLLFASLLSVNMNIIGSGVPPTTIYIDPTPVTALECHNFTVAINIKYVTNLYSWQIKLSFNPNLLECLSVTEGPFLRSAGPTIFPPPIINNAAGTIIAACSLMIPGPGASGSGTLAYVQFHCDGPGECDLVFVYPDTFLLDPYYEPIPHGAVNGHVVQWWVPPEDVELYPPEVVDLGYPVSTQWHELHPSKTNYYHLSDWEPGYVLSPEDQIDMYLIDPPVKVYLETAFVNPLSPWGSEWHELSPTFCQWWVFTSWEDNGDGYLSPCDQIDMKNTRTGEVVWFHVQSIGPPDPAPGPKTMHLDVKYWFQVDEVTVDMTLSPIEMPGPQIFVEYKCGYWTFDPKKPICTKWNQIVPGIGPTRCLHLTSWNDTSGDGELSYCDTIDMTPMYPTPGPVEYYHVDFISISLKLSPKPSPSVVPPPPFPDVPVYLESAISYDEFDLSNPVCTKWHEIYPVYCRIWHLSSWENFYGLSPSDQILLTLKDPITHEPIPGAEAWYHVDKLTVAMNLTSVEMFPGEMHIVKFEESLKEFKVYHWKDPVSTQWHEVNPRYCRQWHIFYWYDSQPDGYLDYCDIIGMVDKETGFVDYFHVESLSTDMWLTIKHDVAVTNVTACYGATIIHGGQICYINVTVANPSYYTETFNTTAYWNSTAIQTIEFTLPSGASNTTCFNWNTTGLTEYLNYTIWAYAHPVAGETNLGDNTFIYGDVLLVHTGDVNGDHKVNVKDIFAVAKAFGSEYPKPPYNPNLDINNDGKINVKDIFATAKNFGWE